MLYYISNTILYFLYYTTNTLWIVHIRHPHEAYHFIFAVFLLSLATIFSTAGLLLQSNVLNGVQQPPGRIVDDFEAVRPQFHPPCYTVFPIVYYISYTTQQILYG